MRHRPLEPVVRIEARPTSNAASLLDQLAPKLPGELVRVAQSDQATLELILVIVTARFATWQTGQFQGQWKQVQELAVTALLFIRV